MRSPLRLLGLLGLLAAAPVALLAPAGCGGGSHSMHPSSPDARQVIASLGRVPVPTAGPAESTPSATPGHPAVLAIGGPVHVRLADGTAATATALGPSQTVSGRAARTPAVIALRLAVTHGSVTIDSRELSSRDETGRVVPLRASGPARMRIAAGSTRSIDVAGTYHSGSAQVTWRHAGHVVAVWTFTIELD